MGFQVECVNGLDLDIMLGSFSVDLRILPDANHLLASRETLAAWGSMMPDSTRSAIWLIWVSCHAACACLACSYFWLRDGILGDVLVESPVRICAPAASAGRFTPSAICSKI